MRIAENTENGLVYRDALEGELEPIVTDEDSLDSLLAQLNELKSKIEAKVNDK